MFICNFPVRNIVKNGTICMAVEGHCRSKWFNIHWPSPAFLPEVTHSSRQAEHMIYPGSLFGFVECIFTYQRTALYQSNSDLDLQCSPLVLLWSIIVGVEIFYLLCCLVADSRMRFNLFYPDWGVYLNLIFLPSSCTADGYNDYNRCWSEQVDSIMDESRTMGIYVFLRHHILWLWCCPRNVAFYHVLSSSDFKGYYLELPSF